MNALRRIKLAAAAVALAGLGALPGCKQQDASLRVNISGPFRMAVDVDTLVIDVLDLPAKNTISHQTYPLKASTVWPATIVLVQSGNSHPEVKINVTLGQSNRVVGRGSLEAVDFADGKTVDVTVDVLPQ